MPKKKSEEAEHVSPLPDLDRMQLLAQVAGQVASGVVITPSKTAATAKAIAEISVDIAEAILRRAGL